MEEGRKKKRRGEKEEMRGEKSGIVTQMKVEEKEIGRDEVDGLRKDEREEEEKEKRRASKTDKRKRE